MKIKDINCHQDFIEIVYGDSVTGDSEVTTNFGSMSIEELFNKFCESSSQEKVRVFPQDLKTINAVGDVTPIKYIMRHRTNKIIYRISTPTSSVCVTEDHSLMIIRACDFCELYQPSDLVEMKPRDVRIGDYVFNVCGEFQQITKIEKTDIKGEFVYDIAIDSENPKDHVFFANDILVHNTDSLYMSYEGLLSTIEGVENMTNKEKTELIVAINSEFLNQHNKEYMEKYFASRHCRDMVHEFELETVAKSGIWLNVKKRYAQILTWKDGKYFDDDALPIKVKGLEIVKSSYPSLARSILKSLVRDLIEIEDKNVIHILNTKVQQYKQQWNAAELESICPTTSVNNYSKYVGSDVGGLGPVVEKGCPFAVRGLAMYNYIRQTHNLPGDPLYGGKMRYYIIKKPMKHKNDPDDFFCFQASAYPAWGEKYAPVDREAMFQRCVLDPFNRILEAIGEHTLSLSGYIQLSLFDEF